MKKIIRTFVIAAAAATALLSCSREMENPVQKIDGKYVYTFDLVDGDASALKTIFTGGAISWEDGDKVGVFAGNEIVNAECEVSGGRFSISSATELASDTPVYAYIPWSEENNSNTYELITVAVAAKQNTSHIAMPAVGIASIGSPSAKMYNLGSIVKFKVYSEAYQSETIKSVKFAASNVAGQHYFEFPADVENIEDWEPVGEYTNEVVLTVEQACTVAAAKADATELNVVVRPGSYSGCSIVVTTDKATYTFTPSSAMEFQRSHSKTVSLNLTSDKRGALPVNTYELVTETLSDWSGEYIIVSVDKARIADTKLSSNGYLTTTTDFTLSDDGASVDADSQNQFTISPASDGKYYITNAAGEYLHLPDFDKTAFGYTSDLSGAPAGYAQWSLSIAPSGVAKINYGIVGNSQRNIGDNGDRDFRGYAGGNFCYLYKNIGASGKTHQTLSFPEESYQVGVDDSFTAPELSGAQTTVTYESSETSVATVDPSTGAITIVGPGSTVITATAEETDSYYSASASYTLTVVGNDCYVKVEANQSDWSGQYLIVYEGGDTPLAFNGGLTTLDAIGNYIEVTIDGKTIAKTAETTVAEFTIAPKSGASAGIYSLKSASGKYISGTTVNAKASNGINTSTSDANYEVTFEYSETDGTSIFSQSSDQKMTLKYNNATDQTRFRFYKSGQQPVALYKYNGAQKETQTISFAEAEISWTVGTDCTFETAKQGQTVTGAQTTVTYSSSDSEVATVANDGKVTPHKAGTVTIIATAAEDDTYASATATYTLNIVDNTDYSGDYVIVYATEKYAMPAYTSGNNIKGITYTLNAENKITADDIDQCKYEIRKVTEGDLAGKYTIKDVNGLYLCASGGSGNNYLTAISNPGTDDRCHWRILQNGDVFDIIAASSNNNEMRFNDNSGSKLFSCYASTSSCEKVSLVPWSNVHVDTTPRIIVAEADKTQNVAAAGKTITVDCTLKNITGTLLGIAKTDADGIIDGTPSYADGKLTIVVKENTASSTKTATVTLSYDGATSVVITINQDAMVLGGDEYQKYTGTLVEGDYVIYYSGKAMKNTVSSSRLDYVEVTPQNDKIVNPDAGIVWHIAPSGSYWTIYNASAAKYAASTGTKNQAALSDSGTNDMSLWTASGTSTYEFVNKNNFSNSVNANLRNNGTYGFACYATGTGGALTLYKKVSDGPTPQPTKLATPSPSFSNNTVSWSAIADAQGYKVKVGASEEVSVSETTYSLASLTAGTYSVTVKAVGNGTTTTDSDWSAAISCTVTGGSGGSDPVKLTFDLSTNPGGWPTTNPTTLTEYTYSIGDDSYTFALKNCKCNSGYLMLTSTAVMGLPAIDGKKLTKVVAKNSSGCSTSVYVGVSSSASTESYITGGAKQQWTKTSSAYTYNLTGTANNTVYYLYVTSKNAQIVSLELTYE